MILCILFLKQKAHSWNRALLPRANAVRDGGQRREAQPDLVNLQLQSLCLLVSQLLDLRPRGLCLGLLGQPGCPLCLLLPLSLLPRSLLSPGLLCQLVVVLKSLCDELGRAVNRQSRDSVLRPRDKALPAPPCKCRQVCGCAP